MKANLNNIEKIQNMSKILKIFSKIMSVTLFVSFCLGLIGILVSIISPENMSLIMSYDKNKYSSVNEVISILISNTATMIILSLIMMQSYKLFKNIQDNNTPFIEENSIILKKMSKLLISFAIIPFALSVLFCAIFSINQTVEFQVGYILIAVIFTCVSYIFSYGS